MLARNLLVTQSRWVPMTNTTVLRAWASMFKRKDSTSFNSDLFPVSAYTTYKATSKTTILINLRTYSSLYQVYNMWTKKALVSISIFPLAHKLPASDNMLWLIISCFISMPHRPFLFAKVLKTIDTSHFSTRQHAPNKTYVHVLITIPPEKRWLNSKFRPNILLKTVVLPCPRPPIAIILTWQ